MSKKVTRGWPPERRRKQAENIRKTRPWEKTTGPRTEEGKAVSAQNALKHGFDTAEMRELKRLLMLQKTFIRQVGAGLDPAKNGNLPP